MLEDINAHTWDKRASVIFIENMGYKKSGRHIPLRMTPVEVSEKPGNLVIFELKDVEDPHRKVPFCYLFDRTLEDGVILPFPYSKYSEAKEGDVSSDVVAEVVQKS